MRQLGSSQGLVEIRLAADEVTVDGVPVRGQGCPYTRTVDYVAALFATHERAPVAAVMTDQSRRMHMRVRPDGRLEDLAVLAHTLEEGASADPPPELLALLGPPSRTPRPSARPLGVALLVLAFVSAGGFAALAWAQQSSRAPAPMASAAPAHVPAVAEAPAPRAASQVVLESARLELAPLSLRLGVVTEPGRLSMRIAASRVPAVATVVLHPADGQSVRRRVGLTEPATVLTFDLAPGEVRWRVLASGSRQSGRTVVPPVAETVVAPQVPVATAPPVPSEGGPKGDGPGGFDTSGELPPGEGPVGVNDRGRARRGGMVHG